MPINVKFDKSSLAKVIVAKMLPDTVPMYNGSCIPVVMASTHSQFPVGARFDWGFVQVALDEGYSLLILPQDKKTKSK